MLNMDPILGLIGRENDLLDLDIDANYFDLKHIVSSSRFLVLGGAGSIGQAVTREIFKRDPKVLHVVDISENNMVELVRDIRSSIGYNDGEFATFAIDVGSNIFEAFIANGPGYDYVLNLSALKHVRSEKDPWTLMRMVDVNVFNTDKTMRQAKAKGAKKYFCVSTDKASQPGEYDGRLQTDNGDVPHAPEPRNAGFHCPLRQRGFFRRQPPLRL